MVVFSASSLLLPFHWEFCPVSGELMLGAAWLKLSAFAEGSVSSHLMRRGARMAAWNYPKAKAFPTKGGACLLMLAMEQKDLKRLPP